MNSCTILAWLDDLQMSAHLAKISTVHSYDLNFYFEGADILKTVLPTVLIVDLGGLSEKELLSIKDLTPSSHLTIIGYSQQIAASQVNYFKEFGCHIVLGRNELLKNLNSIINKAFNAR
jgi:hypothetical protein